MHAHFQKLIGLIFLLGSFLHFSINAQQTEIVDFKKIKVKIELDTLKQSVSGKLSVSFIPKKNIDSVFLDARGAYNVISSKSISFKENKIWIKGKYIKDKLYTVSFNYTVQPKKALYFWGWNEKNTHHTNSNYKQIWTQGQGKYTSHWLPSIDDMNDKIVFDLNFKFDTDYSVIANGNLISKTLENQSTWWHYQMQQPMSSYLVALAIGKYIKKEEKSASGISLENYIYPNRDTDYEPTYRYHKQIFNFLESEIGIPYPWNVYRQVPVRDFLYAGMENTSCTLFDDDFIIDKQSFDDKNYTSVNAHELTHQWFGNLITETESKHHWLHEGFATYYALLAEKEIFGNDYFYFKLYENAELLEAQNSRNNSTPLIYGKSNSLTFYQRGAWTLVALRDYIGDTAFKKSVQSFLTQFAYKNVTTDDFLKIISQYTNKDLSNFTKTWLYNKDFPSKKALKLLTKSKFMERYLALAGQRTQGLLGKYEVLSKALDFPVNPYLGQEVVEQLSDDHSPESISLLKKAFNTNNPIVLQTLATTLTVVPTALKPEMEKLLNSNSYATVESALYNLWNNFEADKLKYLNRTKKAIGFNSKNIRSLWLLLALNTRGFSTEERASFFKELYSYTNTNQSIRLRQSAFQFLAILGNFSDTALQNLALGATHPSWQFNKYCTNLILKLSKKPKFQEKLKRLKKTFPQKVQELIVTLH